MALHLIGNLAELIPYAAKSPRKAIFEKLPCPCKREGRRRSSRIVSDFSMPSEQNLSNDDELSEKNTSSRNIFRKASLKTTESEVVVMLEALLRGVKDESILDLMKSKKHESYALRHRSTEKNETICIFVGENRDFLLQGKRW